MIDIRIKLAEWLLRWANCPTEYRVKRIAKDAGRAKDGRTILRTNKLREACKRLSTMRIADTDTASVQFVARTYQRCGTPQRSET